MAVLNSLITVNIGLKTKEEKDIEKEIKSKTYNTAYGPKYIPNINNLSTAEYYDLFGPFETGGY